VTATNTSAMKSTKLPTTTLSSPTSQQTSNDVLPNIDNIELGNNHQLVSLDSYQQQLEQGSLHVESPTITSNPLFTLLRSASRLLRQSTTSIVGGEYTPIPSRLPSEEQNDFREQHQEETTTIPTRKDSIESEDSPTPPRNNLPVVVETGIPTLDQYNRAMLAFHSVSIPPANATTNNNSNNNNNNNNNTGKEFTRPHPLTRFRSQSSSKISGNINVNNRLRSATFAIMTAANQTKPMIFSKPPPPKAQQQLLQDDEEERL
jgi:hypothetical protein